MKSPLVEEPHPYVLNYLRPFHLTPREKEALALAIQGYSEREIAGLMDISPDTVNAHLRRGSQRCGMSLKAIRRDVIAGALWRLWEAQQEKAAAIKLKASGR